MRKEKIMKSMSFKNRDEMVKGLESIKCGMDMLVEKLREEKCCSICESSEDGCGANDLSEAEYWEMKAEVHFGL